MQQNPETHPHKHMLFNQSLSWPVPWSSFFLLPHHSWLHTWIQLASGFSDKLCRKWNMYVRGVYSQDVYYCTQRQFICPFWPPLPELSILPERLARSWSGALP